MKHEPCWYSKSMYHDGKYAPRPSSDDKYADKKTAEAERLSVKLDKWPVTETSFFKWLATVIVMTQAPQPNLKDYFCNDVRGILGNQYIKARWNNRDEFLHFNFAIKGNVYTIEKLLNENFQQIWVPGSHLAVDETVSPFWGAYKHRVYIPMKPHSTGLKIYELCDDNKFVCKFWMYKGHQPSATNITLDMVYYLKDSGRVVITDSFYGSLELANALQAIGLNHFLLCRIDRPSRLWHKVMIDPYDYENKEWKILTNMKMAACVFKDKKKHVCALSNIHQWNSMVRERRKKEQASVSIDIDLTVEQEQASEMQVDTNEAESQANTSNSSPKLRRSCRWYRLQRATKSSPFTKLIPTGARSRARKATAITKPEFIQYYNKNKAFVDIADRMTASIRYPHRNYKWTKAALWAMISISLWNACVIYKTVKGEEFANSTFQDYLFELLDNIDSKYETMIQCNIEAIPINKSGHKYTTPLPRIQDRQKCMECINTKPARNCNKTVSCCVKCNKWLCKPCYLMLHDSE